MQASPTLRGEPRGISLNLQTYFCINCRGMNYWQDRGSLVRHVRPVIISPELNQVLFLYSQFRYVYSR